MRFGVGFLAGALAAYLVYAVAKEVEWRRACRRPERSTTHLENWLAEVGV